MAHTDRETIRLLCKSIMNRLENKKFIEFQPRLRKEVQDEIFGVVSMAVRSEQDLREEALKRMGMKVEALQESGFTESDQYKAAKSVVKKSYGDDELKGLFFLSPVKKVAQGVVKLLLKSKNIEEVYESDEVLEKAIVETVQTFDQSQAH